MTDTRRRAPYAARSEDHGGRLHDEPPSRGRSDFQRDRDRIIHAAAFRRLQFKTQVFVYHEGDHFRTRLTHTLEVAQVARSVARRLGLDEDLAEAIALAHDLGHPPFGHAGEEELDLLMAAHGGFDHNAQTLRILTKLETRYAAFDGLNLTWTTLEGVVKHNGPLSGPNARTDAPLPEAIGDYVRGHDLRLESWPSAEAQVAALADDVAYTAHDLDDGLRAGLFSVEDMVRAPFVGPIVVAVRDEWEELSREKLGAESVRRLIGLLVEDMVRESRTRLETEDCASVERVRDASRPVIAFSDHVAAEHKALRAFLFQNMYRHHRVNRAMSAARRVTRDLFKLYVDEPDVMPPDWRRRSLAAANDAAAARVACDYIAGMTDRFALAEHRRLIRADFAG